MFRGLVLRSSWPLTRNYHACRNLKVSISPISGIYTYSTLHNESKTVAIQNIQEILHAWESETAQNQPKALSRRFELYDKIRANGLANKEAEWCCDIISEIPSQHTRLADYLFACEALCLHRHWQGLKTLLCDLAKSNTYFWEECVSYIVTQVPKNKSFPVSLPLELIADAATASSLDLASLDQYKHSYLVHILRCVLAEFPTKNVVEALNGICKENPVDASTIATALMRCQVESLTNESQPQSPGERTHSVKGGLNGSGSGPFNEKSFLWDWKHNNKLASDEDLALRMLDLVYHRNSLAALELYDSLPELHSHAQFQALFLASAGSSSYTRLQDLFEEVENDSTLRDKVGIERYEIVIKALGFLGQGGIMDKIYTNLQKNSSRKLTRGIFHAMIFSYILRGDLLGAKKMYDIMITRNVSPTTSTFNLLLRGYKDARDLKGALTFLGDEMLAKFQFPLRNHELSLVLALCATRRDFESANYVWNWANSLMKPNAISWTTYLQCQLDCNQFERAWEIVEKMKSLGLLRIESLTILLTAASRSGDVKNFSKRVIDMAEESNIERDDKWYSALLELLSEANNLVRFQATLKKMNKEGISLNSSHYARYLEILTKNKMFAKCEEVMNEVREQNIVLDFPLIEKYFRSLTAPGSSKESQQMANRAAFQLVQVGYFDAHSSLVPRGAVPVYVIEPVIRRMIKYDQHVTAKQLLDSLQRQRVAYSGIRDEYMLWALYMEIAYDSKNFGAIDSLWQKFAKNIVVLYTLRKPAEFTKSVSGDMELKEPPVFKIPRRYRKDHWRTLSIRIEQLALDKKRVELLDFPEVVESMGLELVTKNINAYIVALVEVGEAAKAFEIARSINLSKNVFISRRAKLALITACRNKQVNYRDYGALGYRLHRAARRME